MYKRQLYIICEALPKNFNYILAIFSLFHSTRHCIVSTKLAEAPTGTEFSMVGVSVLVAPVVSVVTFKV